MVARLLFALTLTGVTCAAAAAAEIRKEVTSGVAEALMPILSFEFTGCAAYPGHNIKITAPPQHGTAALIAKAVPIDQAVPHCKGKIVKPTFVVYRSDPGYRGADKVSVSFTRSANTGEMNERFYTYDFDVTVK